MFLFTQLLSSGVVGASDILLEENPTNPQVPPPEFEKLLKGESLSFEEVRRLLSWEGLPHELREQHGNKPEVPPGQSGEHPGQGRGPPETPPGQGGQPPGQGKGNQGGQGKAKGKNK
ncbi:MAG: hypothetical protein QMD00_05780 [Hadesarchaea archaeon]|nr:hypothetical protein [Hadesarchaea archaeon]